MLGSNLISKVSKSSERLVSHGPQGTTLCINSIVGVSSSLVLFFSKKWRFGSCNFRSCKLLMADLLVIMLFS
ncbi:unnamed protein product [Moneuplotes crassus]|uniref:Uncharacterized protein n=1 Tax=Euplotes crassus TaxID=5936 RepID=A0AAD1XF94_EUPCR|nr:unnamed protein product [Moneuplotes crassus]